MTGIDGYLAVQVASSGFSLATIKTRKTINADNNELAMAA